jgi:RNA polymerase sigma-70 factor, ECF subfamily
VESFESYRPYLFSIAYRMPGSAMDAEDLVQETYLRSQSTPPETIHSLKAFLTTINIRLCMDQLQLACRKREVYVGPWLPEPILTTMTAETLDPAERVEMQSRSRWLSWFCWSSSNLLSEPSFCCAKPSST